MDESQVVVEEVDAVLSNHDLLALCMRASGLVTCHRSSSVSQAWATAAREALMQRALVHTRPSCCGRPPVACGTELARGEYALCGPSFVCSLPGGHLCISDSYNHTVRIIDGSGAQVCDAIARSAGMTTAPSGLVSHGGRCEPLMPLLPSDHSPTTSTCNSMPPITPPAPM